MTTLDIIYTILYLYGTIATIWGLCILLVSYVQGKPYVPIKALVFSTALWPYTMYLSLKATLFGKIKPHEAKKDL